jgi:signal transduction histidine kinase
LIEDLLQASTIFSGKLDLHFSNIDLESLVDSAISAIYPLAEKKEITVHVNIQPHLPFYRGDHQRLQEVVFHLLSNAIKFTPKYGIIRVSLFTTRDSSALQLVVSDTGQGISPEFAPSLFRRFTREDVSTTRKQGGMGLGLAISRQLIEAHGGKIFGESAGKDQGATFIINLPLSTTLPKEHC